MKIYKKLEHSTVNLSPEKDFKFPGGEIGLKLGGLELLGGIYSPGLHSTITQRIQCSDDFFKIAFAKNALEAHDKHATPTRLFLPYVPYARQDRICVSGESLSIKVFADLLNSLKFSKVFIVDPHSHVTEALINNVSVFTQFNVISKFEELKRRILKGVTFVSPDAGAEKKTAELAKYFFHKSFIRSAKIRNLETGDIKETIVYAEDFNGADVVICDDICDGGRTFVELAKVLKTKNCGKIILYVTHGIFSKGLEELYNNGIDEIYTTNSFKEDFKNGMAVAEPTAVFRVETLDLL